MQKKDSLSAASSSSNDENIPSSREKSADFVEWTKTVAFVESNPSIDECSPPFVEYSPSIDEGNPLSPRYSSNVASLSSNVASRVVDDASTMLRRTSAALLRFEPEPLRDGAAVFPPSSSNLLFSDKLWTSVAPLRARASSRMWLPLQFSDGNTASKDLTINKCFFSDGRLSMMLPGDR